MNESIENRPTFAQIDDIFFCIGSDTILIPIMGRDLFLDKESGNSVSFYF